jgi:hypothetical protein
MLGYLHLKDARKKIELFLLMKKYPTFFVIQFYHLKLRIYLFERVNLKNQVFN